MELLQNLKKFGMRLKAYFVGRILRRWLAIPGEKATRDIANFVDPVPQVFEGIESNSGGFRIAPNLYRSPWPKGPRTSKKHKGIASFFFCQRPINPVVKGWN